MKAKLTIEFEFLPSEDWQDYYEEGEPWKITQEKVKEFVESVEHATTSALCNGAGDDALCMSDSVSWIVKTDIN